MNMSDFALLAEYRWTCALF